jgi:hypothetical protein
VGRPVTVWQQAAIKSGRRGSNPRHSRWQRDALPLSYARNPIHRKLINGLRRLQGCCGAGRFPATTASPIIHATFPVITITDAAAISVRHDKISLLDPLETFTRQTQYRGIHFFRSRDLEHRPRAAERPGICSCFRRRTPAARRGRRAHPGEWVHSVRRSAPTPVCVIRFFIFVSILAPPRSVAAVFPLRGGRGFARHMPTVLNPAST